MSAQAVESAFPFPLLSSGLVRLKLPTEFASRYFLYRPAVGDRHATALNANDESWDLHVNAATLRTLWSDAHDLKRATEAGTVMHAALKEAGSVIETLAAIQPERDLDLPTVELAVITSDGRFGTCTYQAWYDGSFGVSAWSWASASPDAARGFRVTATWPNSEDVALLPEAAYHALDDERGFEWLVDRIANGTCVEVAVQRELDECDAALAEAMRP